VKEGERVYIEELEEGGDVSKSGGVNEGRQE
jgi:hypothetical protein